MENRCIQDTKLYGVGDFDKNEGIFQEKGDFEGEKKDKRKAPDLSDAVAIFCGI